MARTQLHFKWHGWQEGDPLRDIMIYSDTITSVATYLNGSAGAIAIRSGVNDHIVFADREEVLDMLWHLDNIKGDGEPIHFAPRKGVVGG